MGCIIQEIRGIIEKEYGKEAVNRLKDEDDIKSQLGMDSLQMVKIITDIEVEYECDLSEIFICEKHITINGLKDYIIKKGIYEK